MSTTAPVTVLYLEYDEDSRKMLSTLLGYDQIDVISVNDADSAEIVSQTSRADLFLLADKFDDPGTTHLCRRLRAAFPNKPIIIYSSNAREVDLQNGLEAGADAYLLKPNSDNIVSTIKALIECYDPSSGVTLRRPKEPAFTGPPGWQASRS